MTKATICYTDLHFKSLTFHGHANFADYGKDIVCSAISTALFTAINIMEVFDDKGFNLEQDEASGFVNLTVLKPNETYDKTLEGLINVLKQIEEAYPQNFKLKITTGGRNNDSI